MKRLVVLLSGNGSNFQSIAESINNDEINATIDAVISDNADAYGLERAKKLAIETVAVPFEKNARDDWEQALYEAIDQFKPDYIVLAGFMKILSADFVAKFPNKIINIHPSLLPKYKGLNTHQRAIDAGDKQAGCTVHIVTEKLDDGPILGQKTVPIIAGDTAQSLAQRVIEQEYLLYPEVLKLLCA